jgi:hypothetical protein
MRWRSASTEQQERRALPKALGSLKAFVLLISGCQNNQLSQGGTFNGLFTGTLKTVWNGGTFSGSYRRFHSAISARMPPDQSPELSLVDANDPAFVAQRPFATLSTWSCSLLPIMFRWRQNASKPSTGDRRAMMAPRRQQPLRQVMRCGSHAPTVCEMAA